MRRFNYVNSVGLTPARAYVKRKNTNLILLHHSGSTRDTVKSIHNYHIGRGHRGIDYNIVVQRDGKVIWGRGLEYEGGHVLNGKKTTGMNARSVGICALGDFGAHTMPEVQKQALKRIVKDVAQYYKITHIAGHDEAAGPGYTDCPGATYPLAEVKAYALGQSIPPVTPATPNLDIPTLKQNLRLKSPMMRGEDVKHVQKRLDKHLVDVGGIDGVFGKRTKAGVIRFQQARINEGRDVGCGYNKNKPDGVVGQKTWDILWE